MELTYAELITYINKYMFPFFRISGFFLIAPLFSSNLISKRIRLTMALVLTIPIAFSVPAVTNIEMLSFAWYMTVIQQIIIGAALGFVFQCTIQSFIIGGQVVAMQSGLGFASMVDPQSGVNVPVLSQFYLMLTTLVFLALNGHLMMIDIVAKSFHTMPIGAAGLLSSNILELVKWTKWIFAAGVLMALPAICALMIVNFSFGIMARSAPQLNIFAVGFPVTLTLGLFIIFLSLGNILPHIDAMIEQAYRMSAHILGEASHVR